jgi:hypothetical protein
MLLATTLLVGTFWLLPVHAWADEPANVVIEILSTSTELVAGAETLWHVRLLTPPDRQIRDLVLRPTDPDIWQWPNGAIALDHVPAFSHVQSLPVVPLLAGENYPSLLAEYKLDGQSQSQIVLGETPLKVVPVTERVTVETWSSAQRVKQKRNWTAVVCVENDAPVSLTDLTIVGHGPGLIWTTPEVQATLPPGDVHCQELSAEISDLSPAPHVEARYTWTDASSGTHSHVARYALATPQVPQPHYLALLTRLPETSISVLLGAGIALLTNWLGHLWAQRRTRAQQDRELEIRKQAAKKRVFGLLALVSTQAEQAANSGNAVALDPFRTAFTSEGLYAAMRDTELHDKALTLWSKAEVHNNGLGQGGGATRSQELRAAAYALLASLEPQDGPMTDTPT